MYNGLVLLRIQGCHIIPYNQIMAKPLCGMASGNHSINGISSSGKIGNQTACLDIPRRASLVKLHVFVLLFLPVYDPPAANEPERSRHPLRGCQRSGQRRGHSGNHWQHSGQREGHRHNPSGNIRLSPLSACVPVCVLHLRTCVAADDWERSAPSGHSGC